jgi:hypothetical protein
MKDRWTDWGDRLCCVLLMVASTSGLALPLWHLWQMPALR